MMKGIYYFEGVNFNDVSNVGIANKIQQQIKCLNSFSDLIVIDGIVDESMFDKTKFLLPIMKSDREKEREKILENMDDGVDYIYIRKPSLTIEFYKLLRRIKKQNNKVRILLEIPTYPFHSEYIGISKLNVIKSLPCERKLRKVIDRILTYSDDKEIWGIPTIKLSNCVVYDDIVQRTEKYDLKEGVVRLTCIAKFMYWHGIDRLINGIKKYEGNYKIILNIVGDGPEINNLMQLAYGMDNIIFYGAKKGKELDEIFDKTDIAIDALGRHRSGVYYNSSLKGKEYAARGLPIVSAVKTELDNMPDFPYYLKIPADESFVDMGAIIKFYNDIYLSDKTKTWEITDKIRKMTRKFFDYKYGFLDKIKIYLSENMEGGGQ